MYKYKESWASKDIICDPDLTSNDPNWLQDLNNSEHYNY